MHTMQKTPQKTPTTRNHSFFEGIAHFWHDRSPRAKEVIAAGVGAAAIIGGGLTVGEAMSPDERPPAAHEQLDVASNRFMDQAVKDLGEASLHDGADVSPEGINTASHIDYEGNFTKISVNQISDTVEIKVGTNHTGPDSLAVATYQIPPEHVDSLIEEINGDGIDAAELQEHMGDATIQRMTSTRPEGPDLGSAVQEQAIDVMSGDGDILLKVDEKSAEAIHDSDADAGVKTKKVIDQFEKVADTILAP